MASFSFPPISSPLGPVDTERLHLRRFANDDIDELAAVFARQEVWQFPYGRAFTRDETAGQGYATEGAGVHPGERATWRIEGAALPDHSRRLDGPTAPVRPLTASHRYPVRHHQRATCASMPSPTWPTGKAILTAHSNTAEAAFDPPVIRPNGSRSEASPGRDVGLLRVRKCRDLCTTGTDDPGRGSRASPSASLCARAP